MKALLIVFFLPNAETASHVQPQFSAVQVDTVQACEAYAQAITALHAENGDPRTLKVACETAAD